MDKNLNKKLIERLKEAQEEHDKAFEARKKAEDVEDSLRDEIAALENLISVRKEQMELARKKV